MNKSQFQSLSEQHKFLRSEYYLLFNFLTKATFVTSICRSNYLEFKTLAEIRTKTSNDKFWTKQDSQQRKNTLRKLNTKLANYLGSVSSAIDYCRNHLVPTIRCNDEVNQIYKKYLEIFIADRSHPFIVCLRNYATHNLPLNIFAEYSMNIQWDAPRKAIYLDKEELLLWKGWNKNAISFLENHQNKVYILELIDEHHERFIQFQKTIKLLWLLANFENTLQCATQFKQILKLVKETQVSVLPFNYAYSRYLGILISEAMKLK